MKKFLLIFLMFFTLLSFTSAVFNYTDGSLVAYYDLNTTSKAIDLTGNGYNGTNNGATTATGIVEKAYDFDGLGSYVNTGVQYREQNSVTTSLWFKTGTNQTKTLMGVNDGTASRTRFIGTETATNKIKVTRYDGSAANLEYAMSYADNQWHHIVYIENSTGGYLYVDGSLRDSGGARGFTTIVSTAFIGARNGFSGAEQWFDGFIDEVLISNRSLNQSEILDLYNNPGYPVGNVTTPTVTLVSPTNDTTISDLGTNFTVSGNNISGTVWDSVTYYVWDDNSTLINSTNVSLGGVTNFTNTQFIDNFGFQDYVWNAEGCFTNSTGSFCTLAEENYTLSVSLFTIVNESWVNDTISGTLEDFSVTIDLLEGYDLLGADLMYNGTSATPSITSEANNRYVLVSDYAIPILSADENLTFYWDLEFTGGQMLQTDTRTQLVRAALLDNCSVYTNKLFNISLHDEAAKTALSGDIELIYTLLNTPAYDVVNTLYFSVTGVSSTEVCSFLNLTNEALAYSAEIRYEASGYEPELYHIQRKTLPSSTDTINLYDLNSSDSTEFKITYQDSTFSFVEGAVVQLQRKYIAENVYEVVEAPLTSSEGTAIVHVDLDSVKYKVTVVKNGELLDTFDNIVFDCASELTGECEQKLLGSIDPQNTIDYDTSRDFTYSVARNENDVTVSFSIPSGEPSSVNIQLAQKDQFGNSTLCNQTVVSSAGSIQCTFDNTIGESYLDLTISKAGSAMAATTYIIPEANSVDFLGNNYILVVILMLSLVGMAITSPEWMIVNGIMTMLLAGALWLVNGVNFVMGLGMLMWLVIAAAILILKLAKQEDR